MGEEKRKGRAPGLEEFSQRAEGPEFYHSGEKKRTGGRERVKVRQWRSMEE